MLTDILPPAARWSTYVAYAVGVVALGAVQIVLTALELNPRWFDIATEVWLYLGAAVGAVAAGNVPDSAGRHRA